MPQALVPSGFIPPRRAGVGDTKSDDLDDLPPARPSPGGVRVRAGRARRPRPTRANLRQYRIPDSGSAPEPVGLVSNTRVRAAECRRVHQTAPVGPPPRGDVPAAAPTFRGKGMWHDVVAVCLGVANVL